MLSSKDCANSFAIRESFILQVNSNLLLDADTLQHSILQPLNIKINPPYCACKRTLKFCIALAARDEKRGQEAVNRLKDAGLNPRLLRLDISDPQSIERARDQLKDGIDVLVCNAGIAFKARESLR